MKVLNLIALLFFLFLNLSLVTGQVQKIDLSLVDTSDIRKMYPNFNYIPELGYVSDKATAIKIATVILESIYGSMEQYKPLDGMLVENGTIWVIIGTTMPNPKGGLPYIEIRKRDGQILKVAHSK